MIESVSTCEWRASLKLLKMVLDLGNELFLFSPGFRFEVCHAFIEGLIQYYLTVGFGAELHRLFNDTSFLCGCQCLICEALH